MMQRRLRKIRNYHVFAGPIWFMHQIRLKRLSSKRQQLTFSKQTTCIRAVVRRQNRGASPAR